MPETLKIGDPAYSIIHAEKAQREASPLPFKVLDDLSQVYKTPLTVILAASEGLNEMGRLSATQAELVTLISEQARHLAELTTWLLTTARLDAREGAIRLKPAGVEPMIDEVLAGFRTRQASGKFAVDLDDDDLTLSCDRQAMLMLLTQFIDSAHRRATTGSTITIRAARDRSEVIFSVHSSGSVIPASDREFIFDQYFLPSSLTNQPCNSTEFGLALAKRIASIHGGRVWVTSSEAEGTAFCAAIPSSKLERCSL